MKNPTTRKRARKRLFIHKTKHFTKLSARTLCRLFLFAGPGTGQVRPLSSNNETIYLPG